MRSDNSMSAKYVRSSVPSCKVLNIPLKKDSLSLCNFRVHFPTSPIWKSKTACLYILLCRHFFLSLSLYVHINSLLVPNANLAFTVYTWHTWLCGLPHVAIHTYSTHWFAWLLVLYLVLPVPTQIAHHCKLQKLSTTTVGMHMSGVYQTTLAQLQRSTIRIEPAYSAHMAHKTPYIRMSHWPCGILAVIDEVVDVEAFLLSCYYWNSISTTADEHHKHEKLCHLH